jgi:mRNA interferase RelE/StbE
MPYSIEIMPHAGRQMKGLPEHLRKRLDAAIRELVGNPRPPGCLKLHAEENAWRMRVGEYRVIYEIHDKVLLVVVIRVEHRSTVYRRSPCS